MKPSLPIDSLLPDLQRTLEKYTRAVLQAAPGAGKTTRVPLALLDAPWLEGKKIIMLEPRRLAARAAARFMARSLGESVGKTVGYRMHLDRQVSETTRVEVVTEGILARMLQHDPSLESVGLVIFDEFHERSLAADLGLALCLDSQSVLREDLRLLVMSATLDGAAVSEWLDAAPLLSSEGRSYPVTVHYHPARAVFSRDRRAFCAEVAQRVQTILREETGSLLVFLPGAGEIRQLEGLLAAAGLDANVRVAPLYGQLSGAAQDAAIEPAQEGMRKVVLATAIAETSLTIEGIRVVVDAGLMRLSRFDPNSGLSRLETRPVSQAAADQRRGRAGRLQAGVCVRMWGAHQPLIAQTAAEILEADLTPLVLELAQWGVCDTAQLRWLDEPPAAHVAQAMSLLQQLGALDANSRITAHGSEMIRFGTHPRLAHMMLRGNELGYGALACELAALLSERDPLAGDGERDADIVRRVDWLREPGNGGRDRRGLRGGIRATARQWQRQLHCAAAPQDQGDLSMAGVLLAFAYPDRIARRRHGSDNRFLMSNGRGAVFTEAEPLAAADALVAAHLDGRAEARIYLAASLHYEQLLRYHAARVTDVTHVGWDEREHCVQARRQQRIGELVLTDKRWEDAPPEAIQSALLVGIRRAGVEALPWTDAARASQARIAFMHRLSPQDWPDVSDAALLATLDDWLMPYLAGMSRLAHLKRLDLQAALLALIPWAQQRQLDKLAPTHWCVPSGSRVRLDYNQEIPVLAVRLQEMFGLQETPCVAGGKVPVLIHLLSPARRPVQITQDLAAFWKGSYHEVRKEMKGRYPKHHWPEDPLQAQPTTRTRHKTGK
ncbi:MAG: ATP-dependent helicase HrpB [Gammaproteobacteria bacterium]|nr:ATP-dependent helicase HrpB [Gammaproteobacteria bacterium]